METARQLVERGEAVMIFPEGTRIRRGSLGDPKRGVGRLALETGAPVVPVAVMGTERARRGFIIRPCKVRVRCGRPLTFPRVEQPSAHLASEVTARIWPCVELQYEWLGGIPALRTAAVVGAGPMGTALATLLARRRPRGRARVPHPRAGRAHHRQRRQPRPPAGRRASRPRLREAGLEDRVPGRGPRRLRGAEPRPSGRRRRGRREHRPPHRGGRLLEGTRAPVRHAPVRVRRRARPRPWSGRSRRAGARRRGRCRRRGARRRLARWRPSPPARAPVREGRRRGRGDRRRRGHGARRLRQERRGAGRVGRGCPAHERRGRRREPRLHRGVHPRDARRRTPRDVRRDGRRRRPRRDRARRGQSQPARWRDARARCRARTRSARRSARRPRPSTPLPCSSRCSSAMASLRRLSASLLRSWTVVSRVPNEPLSHADGDRLRA